MFLAGAGAAGWAVVLAALAVVEVPLLLGIHHRANRSSRKHRLLGQLAAEVNRAVLLNEDENQIFRKILDYAFLMLSEVNVGSVLAFDETGHLVIVASRGISDDYIKTFRIALEDTWQYRQTEGNIEEALIITPKTIHTVGYKFDDWTWKYRSVISAPLMVGGRLYGLLNVDSHSKTFGPDDLEILKRFRDQIEVCLLARDLFRKSLARSRLDGLTQFLNRAAFDERCAEAIDLATRYGQKFTLGMFDVDGLKRVNDALGHQTGDLLLMSIADAIRRTARKSDLLGRYGGDEFVAVFHNTDARTMAERTEKTLAELRFHPPVCEGRSVPASFSFGFADFPADGKSFAELLAVADARLYRIKTQPPR